MLSLNRRKQLGQLLVMTLMVAGTPCKVIPWQHHSYGSAIPLNPSWTLTGDLNTDRILHHATTSLVTQGT
jgi:hypothetical protein